MICLNIIRLKVLALLAVLQLLSQAKSQEADIVIYGGTSAAISAAVQSKRMGKSVVIVSPDERLGGMTSNGLSSTDNEMREVIGGIAREFYQRVWRYYQSPDVWKWQKSDDFGNRGQGSPAADGDQRTMWVFEPKVAMDIFNSWIAENEIEVFLNEWLDRTKGVEVIDRKIRSITCLSGNRYEGKVFLDCTYEGDLMAATGVSYTVGREGNNLYNETINGVQTALAKKNQFVNRVDPFLNSGDPLSGLLPRINQAGPGAEGVGDKKIQAYNFRLCLTKVEENRVPFPKPEKYESEQYELLLRMINRGSRQTFFQPEPIPNAKAYTNNHGAFSTDNIGMNYKYPEATYQERQAIIKEHENFLKGFFYFLCNDHKVPQDIRENINQWGLARDEFINNKHWPASLNVREARRMVGKVILTEHEVMGRRKSKRSVGMGSYPINSQHVQRYLAIDENDRPFILNEGDFRVEINLPYKIPMEILLPKKEECENLLVPVCFSASHVAFCSMGVEPVFMMLGQSAATVAALAVEKEIMVHDVPYPLLREQLLSDSQVLEVKKANRISIGEGVSLDSLGGVVVDGPTVELEGEWIESTSLRPFVGNSYFHDGNGGKGTKFAKFPFVAPMKGLHEIKVAFSSFGNRASNLSYFVKHEEGLTKVLVDQRKPQQIKDLWLSLGTFNFNEGAQYYVSLNNENTEGYVIVDAIQIIGLSSPKVE